MRIKNTCTRELEYMYYKDEVCSFLKITVYPLDDLGIAGAGSIERLTITIHVEKHIIQNGLPTISMNIDMVGRGEGNLENCCYLKSTSK